MSSPTQPGAPAPKDKKTFGKVLARVKTVLKKAAEPSRRLSTLGGSSKAGPSTTVMTSVGGVTSSEPAAPAPPKTQRELYAAKATKVPRAQLFEERAKKLGELYGLELKPSEWYSTEGHALRVEKPIRMRVHRKCHLCEATFGAAKECPKCKHVRCKQCPRLPPKRTEAEKEASRIKRAAMLKEQQENAPIIPDWNPQPKKIVLRRPAKTGGQDLVHKKPRQRVRRTCCECEKLYIPGNKTCEGCQHTRCTDCPRDPAKSNKYPYGYPGDVPGKRSGHYKCNDCQTIFKTLSTSAPTCTKCSCRKCERMAPRKVEPEPDPEVWKSVQLKMAQLKLEGK